MPKSKEVFKAQEEETVWDKKKIFIALFVLLFLFGGLGYTARPYLNDLLQTNTLVSQQTKVEGAKTQAVPQPQALQEKIAEIKETINNLDAGEIASSSPQVQKVMRDIKGLQDYPRNQAKEMCQQVCSRL